MGHNMVDDFLTNFDLNRMPFVDLPPALQPRVSASFVDQLQTSQNGIEHRIRVLEAVNARATQPQRNRRILDKNPPLSSKAGCKRDISHLTKALTIDLDANKKVDNGNFFDCNICLDMARDPILTCCGHLFCWVCFYQVPYIDSTSKECPVCKGEVIDSNVTPIYGNGNGMNLQPSELDSRVKIRIPPRPPARRVESVRKESVVMGNAHIQMADAIRRIRIGLDMLEENVVTNPQDLESVTSVANASGSVEIDMSVSHSGSSRRRDDLEESSSLRRRLR